MSEIRGLSKKAVKEGFFLRTVGVNLLEVVIIKYNLDNAAFQELANGLQAEHKT